MGEKYIPSVTDVIAERKKQNSKSWNRDDSWRVGLIIEGGVMRGVVSAGMVVGLQSLGLFHSFDSIYATSAGSAAAMYFASGQAPEGASIYYQDLTDRNFFHPARIFLGKPPFNVRFLTHEVMWNRKVLNYKRVLESPIPIHTYITAVTSDQKVNLLDIYCYKDRLDLHNRLLHSCSMPIMAGMPIQENDQFFTDGVIKTGGIPLEQALKDCCSHVLILLTRPDGSIAKRSSKLDPIIFWYLRAARFVNLAKAYKNRYSLYTKTLERIHLSANIPEANPQIEAIKLANGIRETSRIEQNETILRRAAFNGYVATLNKFKKYNLPLNDRIQVI